VGERRHRVEYAPEDGHLLVALALLPRLPIDLSMMPSQSNSKAQRSALASIKTEQEKLSRGDKVLCVSGRMAQRRARPRRCGRFSGEWRADVPQASLPALLPFEKR